MKTSPFERFLQDKFSDIHPECLDDDAPDKFDSWLGQLDGDEWMTYADEAISAKDEVLREAKDKGEKLFALADEAIAELKKIKAMIENHD